MWWWYTPSLTGHDPVTGQNEMKALNKESPVQKATSALLPLAVELAPVAGAAVSSVAAPSDYGWGGM